MRKKSILLSLLLLILGCFCLALVFFRDTHLELSDDCIRVPVSFVPFSYKPLIKVGIQGMNYTVMLDTGSSHALDLHGRALEQIQEKKFIKAVPYYDMHGTKYPVFQFQIPEITLHHNLRLNGIFAYRENIDFLTHGTNAGRPRSILGKMKNRLGLFVIDGRLGWLSFEQIPCLFDFHNSSLFLAKNMEAMQKEGIFTPGDFIKAPLELSKCGPTLSIQTELGPKIFLLDTGASYSAYREADLESGNKISLTMTLDGHSIGNWNFWPYPITSNLKEIDGVLGIDFFKTHVICFDFQENHIYLHKTKTNPSSLQSCKNFLRDFPYFLRN